MFYPEAIIGVLLGNGIRICMYDRDRALDNVFVERLWRIIKEEHVYPCTSTKTAWGFGRGAAISGGGGYNDIRPQKKRVKKRQKGYLYIEKFDLPCHRNRKGLQKREVRLPPPFGSNKFGISTLILHLLD